MSNELSILAAVLLDYDESTRFIEEIDPEWFFSIPCRQMFDVMRRLHKEGVGVGLDELVPALVKENNEFTWGAFMAKVMDTPLAANIDRAINRLVGDYTARRAMLICSEAVTTLQTSRDPMGDVSTLARRISSLNTDSNDSFVDAMELTVSSYETIEERINNELAQGLPLGFRSFDKLCNINGQLFVVISGRPSMGKTALMLTAARTQLNRDHKVGIFSLEMPRRKLDQRWIQMDTGLNTVRMNQYRGLNEKELRRVRESCEMRADWNLFIDDSATNIDAIERKIRKMKKLGVEIIYIDQLSKIRGAKGKEYERFTEYSNRLFQMTKELDITIVLLAQLRRPQDGVAVKKPTLSNLKGSGAIEEDADMVFFIHRPEYYAQTDEEIARLDGQAYIDLAKHRDGPVYEDMNITFVKSHGMFADGVK